MQFQQLEMKIYGFDFDKILEKTKKTEFWTKFLTFF